MLNKIDSEILKCLIPVLVLTLLAPLNIQAEEQKSLEKRLERLERLVASDKQRDIFYRFNQLQQENQQLRNMLEEQNYQLQALKKQQQNLYRDMNQRLNQVDRGTVPYSASSSSKSVTTKPAAAVPVVTAAKPGVEVVDKSIQVRLGESQTQTTIKPESISVAPAAKQTPEKKPVYVAKPMSAREMQAEQTAYQKAYDELRAQRYIKARDSFSEFIRQYPHGRYAHIAQYWIAEASYAQKDYQQAVQDYQQLIDVYPNSPKRAEAQLKKAFCFNELGNKEGARTTLKQLLAQYPDTTEATQAKRLLRNL